MWVPWWGGGEEMTDRIWRIAHIPGLWRSFTAVKVWGTAGERADSRLLLLLQLAVPARTVVLFTGLELDRESLVEHTTKRQAEEDPDAVLGELKNHSQTTWYLVGRCESLIGLQAVSHYSHAE